MKQVPQIVALALLACAVSFAQSPTEPNRGLALVGGLIYTDPASGPIRDGVVLVQDGKISAVGRRGSVARSIGSRRMC